MPLTLTSPSFEDGDPIPATFSLDGDNLSPALAWTGTPDDTLSFILVVEDPDAPVATFTHWIAYDIPGDRTGLDQGTSAAAFRQVSNDMGHAHYDGPKPPKGHGPHRYRFRLAALDVASLGVAAASSRTDILNAARPHVLAEAVLTGTFEEA